MDPSQVLPSPEDAVPGRVAPLGAWRCGGRCDDDGFIKERDHIPCPKCRVYSVAGTANAGEFIQIFGEDSRHVRARTALEAIKIYSKSFPAMVKFNARRHNRESGKGTLSFEYERRNEGWKRILSRPSEERAIAILHGRIETAMRIAEKTWKVPGGKVAGVVKFQLDAFMRERSLIFQSRTPCTCGPALLALGKVSASCKAKEHR